MPVLVVLGVLSAATEGLGIGLMIPLFTAIFSQGDQAGEFARWFGNLGQGLTESQKVALLSASILVLAGLRSGILYAFEKTSISISGQVTHRLRVVLFEQLLKDNYAFVASQDRGRVFDLVRGETWMVGELVLLASRALISLCAVAVFGVLLLFLAPPLTLGAMGAAVLIALLVRHIAQRARRLGEKAIAAGADLSRTTITALGSMRTIRLFGQETRERDRFATASERDRVAEQRVDLAAAAIQPLTEVLYAPVFLGILLTAWLTRLEFPTLIAFMVLLYRLQPHARRLDQLRVEIAGRLPLLHQVGALLKRDDALAVASGTVPFAGLRRDVRFEAVSFSYAGGTATERRPAAVSGLTFSLPCKRVTALVGASGSGKSTIVNLLFRLYDPTVGVIRVDGTPLTDLNVTDWRRRLAFAGQDAPLIGDTVLEAVRFGRPEADADAVQRACRLSHAWEFIAELPHGLETPIGENGLQLSVGQRQRIDLARALLREPDLLVLDEATSALDTFSESLVQDALQQLAGRTTMLVIAHRLNTIRDADHVIVLDQGRVAQQGTMSALLEDREGILAQIWERQTAGAVVDDGPSTERSVPVTVVA